VLGQDNQRLSEAKELRPQSQGTPGLSTTLGVLIAVVSLRDGSGVMGGFSARGSRTLHLEIGPTISHLLLMIIGIDVNHLLHSSCRVTFPNFVGLMQRYGGLRPEVQDRSVSEAAGGGNIAVDSSRWPTFVAILRCSLEFITL
jgi:hypothetical protein